MNTMLRKLILGIIIPLCFAPMAYAIMANPNPITITQPDGSQLTIRLHGDESFHYTTTQDGYLIRKDVDGFFKYYDFENKKLTKQVATNADYRTAQEAQLLSTLAPAKKWHAQMVQEATITRKAPRVTAPKVTHHSNGAQRAAQEEVAESQYLVILVGFSDRDFTFTNHDFDIWLNEKGYSVNGGTGSVKDYYRDNSMGQFIPHFTVLGPYTLPYPQLYYAGNSEETGEDRNPRAMIVDACNIAKQNNPDLDFSIFDNNKDGYMDNVNVVYAGYSEASTGNGDDMWPHSWTLEEFSITIDNTIINAYGCSAEFVGASGEKMDGIGTFAHEFGHVLGLKDTYDTDQYTDGYGIDPGDYSMFASGSYNNESRTPPYLMTFERSQMGWCTPIELNEAADISLNSLGENVAYYINAQPNRAAGTGHEWFVLENRQKTGWDSHIPAHGLLIYHYDYTDEMVEQYWSYNAPNNNSRHRCIYIKPADGIDDSNTRNGDTYPGRSGNTQFTDFTTPNAINWAGEPTNTPITNIREEDGVIYFQVKGGIADLPIIRTESPRNVRDTSLEVAATIDKSNQAIIEMGFCWDTHQNPNIATSPQSVVATNNTINYTITGLNPGTLYYVRAFMRLEDNNTIYGAAIPVKTECALAEAPYIADFTSWSDGEPDCWKIVDNNGDGTTWIFDDTTQGLLYQFDYWNNADDWVISTRMLVPDNGHLYFVRGIVEQAAVEKLDVYVSTHSREIEDFHLVKQFSFADNFGYQVPEEVDLSAYAGQEVYIALVCTSEKLQSSLWLWQIYLASKLDTPQFTKFGLVNNNALEVEWTPVENAARYHLEFYEVTDEVYNTAMFFPPSEWEVVEGDVELSTGTAFFTGDGVLETRAFPDGITDLIFIITTSGPTGTTTLTVEGSEDGEYWEQIGPVANLNAYNPEGVEMMLSEYLTGRVYQKLRLTCHHGGRNIQVRYFTVGYNDGYVWELLTSGAVQENSIVINETFEGEFTTGKEYAVIVYSGDGILYFDASEPAFYSYSGSVEDILADNADIYADNGNIYLSGITTPTHILCTTPEGIVLYNQLIDRAASHVIDLNDYKGIVLVNMSRENESKTFKLIVK